MGELNLKLETKEVKGGEIKKLTVKNVFYKGFWGKLKTFYYWFSNKNGLSFKEYLDFKVTYEILPPKDIDSYYNIEAEDELKQLLIKELGDELNRNESNDV